MDLVCNGFTQVYTALVTSLKRPDQDLQAPA